MGEDLPQSFGSYTLHDLVARGGMAEIYRATMPGIGGFEKTVAIKKILPHLAENEEFITMLIDEARIIVSINHSNIAQVYDLGKIEDTYYIAMEYIHGIDLSGVIKGLKKRGEYIPMDHVAHIGSCICAGLHAAHSKTDENGDPLNIVHRDVSPHNVLISYAGDVKIIDFGVAKATVKETHTKMGVIKGKLLYMAPEQAMAKDLDGRADLFAVGLCLYKMLTHELPFAGDNEFQIYNNILSKEIVPPKQLNPDVPEELNQIVMTLLQRDPDKRYQDGYAAKQDLDRCLHNIAPGYTINRLSRFVEENFSKAAREKAREKDDSTEASRPQGIAPTTPSSNEVDTGQITAERRKEQPASDVEGDPTVNMSRGEALADLAHVREPAAGVSAQSDGLPGPPALPDEPMSDQPARTQTNADQTGQFAEASGSSAEADAKKSIPPVMYAIVAMIIVIVGMSAYALFSGSGSTDSTETSAESTAVAQKPEGDSVAIKLDTEPQGATVLVDGDSRGTTPADFELEKSNRPVTISFEKDGFDSKRVRLVPNSSIDRVIALTRSLDDEAESDSDAGDGEDGGEQLAENNDETRDEPDERDERDESGSREPDRDEMQDKETASGSAPKEDSSGGGGDREKSAAKEAKDEPSEQPVQDKKVEPSPKEPEEKPEEKPAEDEDDDFIPVLDDGPSGDSDSPSDEDENSKDKKKDEGLIDPFG
ncbi:MAG: protein kinase domain-containing protein [Myxococcota bacterium]